MRKHVIQFEIEVPDKTNYTEVIKALNALLELLEFKSKNLELDPPKEKEYVPLPILEPLEKPPYKPPYNPPWEPHDNPPPWQSGDLWKKYQSTSQKVGK